MLELEKYNYAFHKGAPNRYTYTLTGLGERLAKLLEPVMLLNPVAVLYSRARDSLALEGSMLFALLTLNDHEVKASHTSSESLKFSPKNLNALVKLGYAEKRKVQGLDTAFITPLGSQVAREYLAQENPGCVTAVEPAPSVRTNYVANESCVRKPRTSCADVSESDHHLLRINKNVVAVLQYFMDGERHAIREVSDSTHLIYRTAQSIVTKLLDTAFLTKIKLNSTERKHFGKAEHVYTVKEAGRALMKKMKDSCGAQIDEMQVSNSPILHYDCETQELLSSDSEVTESRASETLPTQESLIEDQQIKSMISHSYDMLNEPRKETLKMSDLLTDILLEFDIKDRQNAINLDKRTCRGEVQIRGRLRSLVEKGFATSEREGNSIIYQLNNNGKKLKELVKNLLSFNLVPKVVNYSSDHKKMSVDHTLTTTMHILEELNQNASSIRNLCILTGASKDVVKDRVRTLVKYNLILRKEVTANSSQNLIILDAGRNLLRRYRMLLMNEEDIDGDLNISDYIPDIVETNLSPTVIEILLELDQKKGKVNSDFPQSAPSVNRILKQLNDDGYTIRDTTPHAIKNILSPCGAKLKQILLDYPNEERKTPKISVYNAIEDDIIVVGLKEAFSPIEMAILQELIAAPLSTPNIEKRFTKRTLVAASLAHLSDGNYIIRDSSRHGGYNSITERGRSEFSRNVMRNMSISSPPFLEQSRGEFRSRRQGLYTKILKNKRSDAELMISRPLNNEFELRSSQLGPLLVKMSEGNFQFYCPSRHCVTIRPAHYGMPELAPDAIDTMWEIVMGYSPVRNWIHVIWIFLLRICYVSKFRLSGHRDDGEPLYCMEADSKTLVGDTNSGYLYRDPLTGESHTVSHQRVVILCHPQISELQASQLCHQAHCFHPEHIFLETSEKQVSRATCSGDNTCAHDPKCLLKGST